VATHEGWNVPLVGGSHRWAAAVILVLGAVTCGLGDGEPRRHVLAAILGAIALPLAVLARATGSLTPLSTLVADVIALWAVSTFGHAVHPPVRPHPA
jgi:hypothetical protein